MTRLSNLTLARLMAFKIRLVGLSLVPPLTRRPSATAARLCGQAVPRVGGTHSRTPPVFSLTGGCGRRKTARPACGQFAEGPCMRGIPVRSSQGRGTAGQRACDGSACRHGGHTHVPSGGRLFPTSQPRYLWVISMRPWPSSSAICNRAC